MCLQVWVRSVKGACASHLWSVRLYNIVQHYLINENVFEKKVIELNRSERVAPNSGIVSRKLTYVAETDLDVI
jgi:hypothetical protein